MMANLYMDDFKWTAIRRAENPPRILKRYMAGTFVVQQQIHEEIFLHHINSLYHTIQFAVENTRPNTSMPFLETMITLEPNRTLATGVDRKPIHTDQYL